MTRILTLTSAIALVTTLAACGSSNSPTTTTATGSNGLSSITTLQTTDVRVGTGAEAVAGRSVSVHYTGWLYSETAADKHGTKFDSSLDRNQPFQFILGAGQVIRGWDQGVVGMKVGGQRTLVIPPSLGYGSAGASGVIPGNATLVFDIQLLSVN